MSSVADIIKYAKCEDLHCMVDNGSSKYLCFTRIGTNYVFCVSDGVDVWKLEVDYDELDVLRELCNLNMEAYLSNLRCGFRSGDIQISQIGVKVNMVVGNGSKSLSFDLFEAKAAEKKTELQNILFRLAYKSSDLMIKLEKANSDLDALRSQKGAAAISGSAASLGIDLDSGKGKNQLKAPPKQLGMSVINPASKKRKVAKGISYD